MTLCSDRHIFRCMENIKKLNIFVGYKNFFELIPKQLIQWSICVFYKSVLLIGTKNKFLKNFFINSEKSTVLSGALKEGKGKLILFLLLLLLTWLMKMDLLFRNTHLLPESLQYLKSLNITKRFYLRLVIKIVYGSEKIKFFH